MKFFKVDEFPCKDYIFLDLHSYILHLIYQTYIAKILQHLLLQI